VTAEAATSKVLDDNQSKINNFLKGKEHQLIITQKTPEPIGTSWKRRENAPTVGTEIRLIIRKDKKMPDGYRIHTGFPNP
jgi:hypothetical protein